MQRALLLTVLMTLQGVPAVFDTSGIDAFWRVQGQLAREAEPAQTEWDALFATPGYAALEEREKRRSGLTQAMRLAFTPSLARSRDSAVRTNTFIGRATRHLMGVPAARDSIDRFLETLRATGALDVARRRVGAFLPAGLSDSVPPPPVALVFFLDDGRGYPAIIVADLLRLTRAGVDTGYFAHEFYHLYRRRFVVPRREPRAADLGLAELLEYPVEEGLADQLDKRRYMELDSAAFEREMARPGAPAYLRSYRDAYHRPAEWFARVSRALERGIAKPDSASAFARAMRDSIPDQGRALGAFMARTIDRAEGRARLITASRDAYDLWSSYDDVAAKDRSLPRLSRQAMAVVRRLARARQ